MAQERWLEDSTNQLNRWTRQNPVYPTPSSGYQITLPQYNSYWSQRQYLRPDYTQPIQSSQTPPINQALNETFQPQYIQMSDYNGQPVRIPATAGSQVLDNAVDWVKERAMDAAPLVGLVGKGILANEIARYEMAQPRVANTLATLAAMRYGKPIIEGLHKIVYNPLTDKIENGVRKFIDWTGGGF